MKIAQLENGTDAMQVDREHHGRVRHAIKAPAEMFFPLFRLEVFCLPGAFEKPTMCDFGFFH